MCILVPDPSSSSSSSSSSSGTKGATRVCWCISAFFLFSLFFYIARYAILFVAVAELDRWWLSPAAFPRSSRFGPRVSSQWMETTDYVCATFDGSGCISLCATLIRKMNDLVSGSQACMATLVKRFTRFRFTANGLKRIESLINFWRFKCLMGHANIMMDAHLLHKGNGAAFVFTTRWQKNITMLQRIKYVEKLSRKAVIMGNIKLSH